MGFEVYEGYGLTETSPVLTVNPPHRARAGSVGPPLPGVKVDVRHCNLSGIGDIWVQGDSVMSGYLKNPDATKRVLVDGWFCTGDLGRCVADGFVVLTGRSTDLIVTGAGKNVYPDEVEAHYQDLPYVAEVCVFGLPAEDCLGDTVHAVMVFDSDATAGMDRSSAEREVRMAVEVVSESLPSQQRIATLHFWDRQLPKTSTFKAKRTQIRDMVLAERHETIETPDDTIGPEPTGDRAGATARRDDDPPGLPAVRRILARASGKPLSSITRSMHLHLDLGIDSIGKMDVLGSIETRFGVQVTGVTAAKVARVSDLLAVIGDRKPKRGAATTADRWPKRLREPTGPALQNGPLPAALVPMRWLVRGGVTAFMNTYVRVRARGRENIPTSGPFILAPNHASHLDSPAVITAIGDKRRVWVAGAEDYFFNTPIKRLVFGQLLDTIPFDRHGDGVAGLYRCGEALRRGDGLLIFPEGTRSTTGELQPFKVGVALLAVERNAPIIPVYIHRAFDLLSKGKHFIKPGAVTVTFAKPIPPSDLDDQSDRQAVLAELTRRVEAEVEALAMEALA